LLTQYSQQIIEAGRESGNAAFEDLSAAAALYIDAYVVAGDDYTNADSWLIYAGFRISNLLSAACRAIPD
jgi:hypothetical protein